MTKWFLKALLIMTLSTQLVFAKSNLGQEKARMYNNMVKFTKNISHYLNKEIKKTPELKASYIDLAKNLKSGKCKLGIKKDLSMIFSCGKKKVLTQFFAGKNYFLINGKKLPYSILDDKEAFLKRGSQILTKKNKVGVFLDRTIRIFFPNAQATGFLTEIAKLATHKWALPALLTAGVVAGIHRHDKKKRKRRNAFKEDNAAASAGSGSVDLSLPFDDSSRAKCSVNRYLTIRKDVDSSITKYYQQNNITKSDESDYERVVLHYKNHGFDEGMCKPLHPSEEPPADEAAAEVPSPGTTDGGGESSGGGEEHSSGEIKPGDGPPGAEPVGPSPGTLVLVNDPLNGSSIGKVNGGSFTSKGWTNTSGTNHIIYDIGEGIEAGEIEFEMTNLSSSTKGGYTGNPVRQRAHYFGFYNKLGADKRVGNPAFIDIRYNWGSFYNEALKLEAGAYGLDSRIEYMGKRKKGNWDPNKYHKNKIVFGNGEVKLYIDGVLDATTKYKGGVKLGWRYLYLGSINYCCNGGPVGVTYRNLVVTRK